MHKPKELLFPDVEALSERQLKCRAYMARIPSTIYF